MTDLFVENSRLKDEQDVFVKSLQISMEKEDQLLAENAALIKAIKTLIRERDAAIALLKQWGGHYETD